MGRLSFSRSSSIFLLIIIVLEHCFHVYSITHWEDVQALKQFRNGVDSSSVSPGSCLSSWDFSVDPCESLSGEKFTCGIRCDVVMMGASRITELNLDRAGYSGSLAYSSWNLPYLQNLDLTSNYFTGSIPDDFSRLTRLQRLTLSSNLLNGSIPDSVCSLPELEELFLDNNNLQGPIPSGLNGLKSLKRLEVQGNRLSDVFPELAQLSNLDTIDASNNAITGELPANFPVNLIQLSMRNNSIQGNIPASLLNNSVYLQVLDMSYNKLSGWVPAGLFTHPSLEQLTLSYNQYGSFEVPSDSGRGSQLIAVDLSNNELRGFLPIFMGWMPKLSALSLENNKLTGMIPTQYALKAVVQDPNEGGVAPFERLLLGGNYLFGLIPGPFLQLNSGSGVTIRLGDNCLYECPLSYFICEGGQQKTVMECKGFSPNIIIP